MSSPPDKSTWRRDAVILGIPACVVFILGWIRASTDTTDDAYITFRCLQNLIEGHGLTFNPGTRVEAFSNPLLAFLLIPFAAVGASLELAAMLIGFISFVACIYLAYRLTLTATDSESAALTASACVLGCFPLLYYSVTGLETGLFAALLLAALTRLCIRQQLDPAGALIWSALLLCRPEAPAYLIAILPAVACLDSRARRASIAWWLACAGFLAAALIARRLYYGLWLPNPFYAKAAGTADLDPATNSLQGAAIYVSDFTLRVGILPVLLSILTFVLRFKQRFMLPLLCTAGTGLAFAVYTGGDWFPAGRYLVPIAPILFVAACCGLATLRPGERSLRLPMLLAASVLIASLWSIHQFKVRRDRYPFHVMNAGDCASAAIWMRQNLPAETRIAAYRIGALGYFSRLHVIDVFGLADHDIAVIISKHPDYHPGRGMGDQIPELRAYLAAAHPDAVLYSQNASHRVTPAISLYGYTYSLLRAFPQGSDQVWLLYVENRNAP